MNPLVSDIIRLIKGQSPPEPLTVQQWRDLLRIARSAGVLARLQLSDELLASAPEQFVNAYQSALRHAVLFHNQVKYEVHDIATHCHKAGVKNIILLKGAAYVLSGQDVGRGRVFSDIDMLVNKDELHQVEKTLSLFGWFSLSGDAYDEKYYREWAHEIPPLKHTKRKTILDVHHNIVPPISGRSVNMSLLTQDLTEISPGITCLNPAAMTLHSAVHLFFQEEFPYALRDLSDLYLLFKQFGDEQAYWQQLVDLAKRGKFEHELFFAHRFVCRSLDCEFPVATDSMSSLLKPSIVKLWWFDWVFSRVFTPKHVLIHKAGQSLANFCALLRGHLIKMPLPVLIRHTLHKLNCALGALNQKEKHAK